jgi:hypothetical protein
VTTATVTGTHAARGTSVFVGSAHVALSATDDLPGSGLGATNYQVVPHGSVAPSASLPGNWLTYVAPFDASTSSAGGDLDVYAFSEDQALNAELPHLVAAVGQAPLVSIWGAPNQEIELATSVALLAGASGGAAPYTYSWSKNGAIFGGNTPSIIDTPVSDTSYAVTVTDSFSLQSNTAQVTVSVTSGGGGGSGGCDGMTCPLSPGATPELDSLLLFASGLAGLGGYGALRLRGRKRRR